MKASTPATAAASRTPSSTSPIAGSPARSVAPPLATWRASGSKDSRATAPMAYMAASRVRKTTEPSAIPAPPLLQEGIERDGDPDAGAGCDELEQHAADERARVGGRPRETVRVIHNRSRERGSGQARHRSGDEQHARAEGCFTVGVHALLLFTWSLRQKSTARVAPMASRTETLKTTGFGCSSSGAPQSFAIGLTRSPSTPAVDRKRVARHVPKREPSINVGLAPVRPLPAVARMRARTGCHLESDLTWRSVIDRDVAADNSSLADAAGVHASLKLGGRSAFERSYSAKLDTPTSTDSKRS